MNLERVDEEIKKELNEIIAHELSDPRIDTFVSVTRVESSKDLTSARVYVSIFDSKDKKAALDALIGAASFMRNKLFHRLKVRMVPELRFMLDEGIAYSFKMSKILQEIKLESIAAKIPYKINGDSTEE